MLYGGTEVGCCAIMYEKQKGVSKEASSKGNKQRQTGLCLPVALHNYARGLHQENQQTPTHLNKHFSLAHSHTASGDPIVLLFCCTDRLRYAHTQTHIVLLEKKCACLYLYMCVFLCVFVCVHTWMNQCQCQGVGHCCLGPKQAPVSSLPPSTQRDRQAAQQRCRVDGGEQGGKKEKKKERARKENKGRLKEKD